MRQFALIAGLTLAVASLGGAAAAQGRSWLRAENSRLTAVVGAFVPTGGLADASSNTVGGSLSVGFELQKPRPSRPLTASVVFETAGISRGVPNIFGPSYQNRTAETFSMEGLSLDGTLYLLQGGQARVYLGAGLGLYRLQRKLVVAGGGYLEGFTSREVLSMVERYNPGLRAFAGLELGRSLALEARYLDAGPMDGVRFQGISLALGIRTRL